jgi:hypothetical protein
MELLGFETIHCNFILRLSLLTYNGTNIVFAQTVSLRHKNLFSQLPLGLHLLVDFNKTS